VYDRVEHYILLSALHCTTCNEIHGEVTVNGRTVTADMFDITAAHEWDARIVREEEWIRDNAAHVRTVLPDLATEWPDAVTTIRTRILG
jgi:hypothetical protein